MMMTLRKAAAEDLDAIAAVEAVCFPEAEAASRESLEKRLSVYPEHFWLLEEDGKLISFVNGMVTNLPDLTDEMYENAAMHDESGDWQMIFGVDTIPSHRKMGCAGKVLRAVIEETRQAGRKGLVLTCKERLVPFYAGFGFVDEGVSASEHGGVIWHQMRLRF